MRSRTSRSPMMGTLSAGEADRGPRSKGQRGELSGPRPLPWLKLVDSSPAEATSRRKICCRVPSRVKTEHSGQCGDTRRGKNHATRWRRRLQR